MTKFYGYSSCDSCRKAKKFLEAEGVEYEAFDIVKDPPSEKELRTMLKVQGGSLKSLFNTSGQLYRQLKMAEKLPNLSESEAISLLARNGKMIKRPFVLQGDQGLVGFREGDWKGFFN